MTSSCFQEVVADFIVVGSGTAGCVVATRLAEAGFEILLISSGFDDTTNPMIRKKSNYFEFRKLCQYKHCLFSSSSNNSSHPSLNVDVVNSLGGSSINGGGMQRLTANDWQYFVDATGDKSFDLMHMRRYYRMVENFASTKPLSTSEIHGDSGPIKVTHVRDAAFNDVWKNVADELSETFIDDLAGDIDYGFSFEPSAFTDGLRNSSGDSYLIPAMQKYPNLKVFTGATATKFDLNEETKAISKVLFVSSEGFFSGIATKEYILSAGAIFSPHLLMLSGIGDPKILRQHSIPVKHELVEVGKNLADNTLLIMEYDVKNISVGQSIPVALVNNSLRTTHTNPDTFLVCKMDDNIERLFIFIFQILPKQTIGSVSLYNSNPLTPPNITLDYLTDDNDIQELIDSINYVRRIMSTNALKQFAPVIEVSPGENERDLSQYIRNSLEPGHHFTGTCSMGRNSNNSVVDSNFKVHGIMNIRIVDGSIFPAGLTTKSGTCLTIYALAEKAADILSRQYS